jgi:hypothetical protein
MTIGKTSNKSHIIAFLKGRVILWIVEIVVYSLKDNIAEKILVSGAIFVASLSV